MVGGEAALREENRRISSEAHSHLTTTLRTHARAETEIDFLVGLIPPTFDDLSSVWIRLIICLAPLRGGPKTNSQTNQIGI